MSGIEVPEIGKIEGAGVILLLGVGAYLAYRMWTAGSSIADSIGNTLSDAGKAVGGVVDAGKVAIDNANLALIKNEVERNGVSDFPISDKWDSIIQNAPKPEPDPIYDPMTGVVIGQNSSDVWFGSPSWLESPDASGLIAYNNYS